MDDHCDGPIHCSKEKFEANYHHCFMIWFWTMVNDFIFPIGDINDGWNIYYHQRHATITIFSISFLQALL